MILVFFAACSGKGSSTTAGTTTTPSGAAPGSTFSSTTQPTFSGSTNSKFCVLARQFSTTINGNVAQDPKTLFQEFDAQSAQFLALVPSAIKGDAETVVNALHQLEVSFQAVDYDVTKITPAQLAPLQNPNFASAAAGINTYDAQVCGISPPST